MSDTSGKSSFQLVKNAPAYSGIKKRHYDISNPDIEEITVKLKTLDEIIPENEIIDFIKIDVEGAEFCVLKGGKNLLKKISLLYYLNLEKAPAIIMAQNLPIYLVT